MNFSLTEQSYFDEDFRLKEIDANLFNSLFHGKFRSMSNQALRQVHANHESTPH